MQTKTPYISVREQTTAVPLGNFDTLEDETVLVNRLYYAEMCIRDSPGSVRQVRGALPAGDLVPQR